MNTDHLETRGLEKLSAFLDRQPKGLILAVTLISMVIIAILDFLTGKEITFSFIYIAPIALAAWINGPREGIFLSVASALIWTLVNHTFTDPQARLLVSYWNAGAHLGFFLMVTFLIAELRLVLDKEKTLARTDFLTGALNRRAFYEMANLELTRLKRSQRPFTMIYMDIDDFKAVNDRRGHDTGDQLLKLVAETLAGHIRPFDSVGRLGGDEFAILMPETNQRAARSIAPRLQNTLLTKMRENDYPVTFSMGTLTYIAAPETIEQVLKLTDLLLYRVKKAGKNAIEYAEYNNDATRPIPR
jgi:diguanylate cyclase (GGDEF)-like protein